MKIIVEEGEEAFSGLSPGTYHMDATSATTSYEYNVPWPHMPGQTQKPVPTRRHLTLTGYLRTLTTNDCDNPDGPCACGAWHDSKDPKRAVHAQAAENTRRRFHQMYKELVREREPENTFGHLPPKYDMVDKAIAEVVKREKQRRFMEAYGVRREKVLCDECSGSGEWENPANGKRSPCSRGCKP